MRLNVDSFLEGCFGIANILKRAQSRAQANICIDISRVKLDGFLEMCHSLLELSHIRERDCDIEVTLRRLLDLESLLVGVDRLLIVFKHVVGVSEVIVRRLLVCVKLQGTSIHIDCVHKVILLA